MLRKHLHVPSETATQPSPGLSSSTGTSGVPNGSVAAAVLAAGIGCFVLGLTVVIAGASKAVAAALTFSNPVGPLSGKTAVPIVVWLLSWAGLHLAWRKRQVNFAIVYAATLVLIALGLVGTFPPFYDLFAAE